MPPQSNSWLRHFIEYATSDTGATTFAIFLPAALREGASAKVSGSGTKAGSLVAGPGVQAMDRERAVRLGSCSPGAQDVLDKMPETEIDILFDWEKSQPSGWR